MDYRQDLELSVEELRYLEDMHYLTGDEFNKRYGKREGEKEVRRYFRRFPEADRGIRLIVSQGDGNDIGYVCATLFKGNKCVLETELNTQYLNNGNKVTGEWFFRKGNDTFTVDVRSRERLPNYKVKSFRRDSALYRDMGIVLCTFRGPEGRERDAFWRMDGPELKGVYKEAESLETGHGWAKTGIDKFWVASEQQKLACIQKYMDRETEKGHEVFPLAKFDLKELSPSSQYVYACTALAVDWRQKTPMDEELGNMVFSEHLEKVLGKPYMEILKDVRKDMDRFSSPLGEPKVMRHFEFPEWVQERIERDGSLTNIRARFQFHQKRLAKPRNRAQDRKMENDGMGL